MKKITSNILIPILLAVLFGIILGRYTYKTYKDNLYHNLRSSKLYLIENGEYNTIDNMKEENSTNNYIYYKDNNKYKTIIGITNNKDNIDKIKNLYNDNLLVEEYYIESNDIDTKQLEYEKVLSEANDIKELKDAVDNILNLYKNDNNIRLIQLN